MTIQVRLATPDDDASIRALLRREPIPGRIAITYEREPAFALGCDATGEHATTLVARDLATGAVVGVACRSDREVYVNGRPVRLGYLGQLRIDRQYRGRWLLSRGYSLLRHLHDRDPVPGYLAAVTADNREAVGVLVERLRKRFPVFRPIADYCTLALQVRRASGATGTSNATASDMREVVRFLQSEGVRRQFSPVWTEARLLRLIRGLGLRLEDIQIARRHGAIAGLMALWDQSAFKQNVVRAYSGWIRFALPLYNASAPLLQRPRLPAPGGAIRSAYASLVCVAQDDVAVFDDLLNATLARAAAHGLDYLLLGLDARDPLLPAARAHSHVLYGSRLYLGEWPGSALRLPEVDSRPSYVEIATL